MRKARGTPAPKRLRKPRQVAAIDVGSTSVRMQVAEIQPDGMIAVLDELVHPVALGNDTFQVGYITAETMRTICQVARNFVTLRDEYKVRDCRAVATSALREAQNKDLVLDRIRHDSGLEVTILDEVEESRLSYQVLVPFLETHLGDPDAYSLFIDLGGGSTETLLLQGRDLVLSSNRKLGTARLFHSIQASNPSDSQILFESVIRNVVNSTFDHYNAYPISNLIVVNSTLQAAFDGHPGVGYLDGGLAVPAPVVRALAEDVQNRPVEGISERYRIQASHVSLLLPALNTVDRFLRKIGTDTLYVVQLDLLTAILHDLSFQIRGLTPELLFGEQIVRSAIGFADKYQYNPEHGNQVSRLAVRLYDQLAGYLGLSGKDRLYLQVAGLLHDIGMYINEIAHHKHSRYLIEWGEIVGLNQEERRFVALVARYHRKAHPGPSHPDFMQHCLDERLRITKLAAILRIADALDRSHLQLIRDVEVSIEEKEVLLQARGSADLVVETVALKEKGRLFEDVTGLRPRLVPDLRKI